MDTSKIIIGTVGGGRYTVTAPIVKEDYGLYLQIKGLELPSSYEVDFSNSEHNGTSVTMIGNSDGVLIPHQFIDTGKDIFAFLYHVGADYGRTLYKFRIPNKLRPDRTDEEPTPEQASTIDQVISALNDAVTQTAQDVIDADASAQSASQSAENAHDSAVDAQNYAESASGYASDAQGYATTASQKATEAGNSADQAAQIKTDIEGYVSTAQGYAQTATDKAAQASQSATNASNSATTASTKAGEASASATTASNKAGEASASATTASNKATEASGYANTASQKASDASDSASAALGYKTDAESAKTASQTAQGLAEDAQEAAESAAASIQSSAAQIATNTADIADLQTDVAQNEADILKAFPTDSASGAIASFSDGADDIPLKSLVVDINPVQDLHGQNAPYPAGGGSNLLPFEEVIAEGWTNTLNGLTATYSKGYMKVTGTNTSDGWTNIVSFNDTWASAQKLIHLSAGTYSMSLYLTIKCAIDGASYVNKADTFTANESVEVRGFYISVRGGETVNWNIPLMFVRGTERPTTYVPYENICPISGWTEVQTNQSDADMTNPTTLTIQLGQTVYGGKLDVLSGVLTVDMAMVDLGTLNWAYNATYNFFLDVKPTKAYGLDNATCSVYAYGGWWTGWTDKDNVWCGNLNNNNITIKDTRYSDVTAFKAAMSGVQFCYELAEPIEIQLSPNQINSLLGINNIWADSGDTEVEYRADPTLYISRLTEPDADMIADSNIVSGQYFMVGNNLYKATANIASGSAVVVGTNATRKSLSEALNEINA